VSKNNNVGSAIGHDPLAWITEDDDLDAPVDDTVEVAPTDAEVLADADEAEPAVEVEEAADEAAVVDNIALQGALSIIQVRAIYQQLNGALQGGSPAITLDFSEVKHIDTAVLQVLYGFSNEAKRQSVTLHWVGVQEKDLATAQQLGIANALGECSFV